MLYFMSIENLVKEEINRQIDNAVGAISVDRTTFSSPVKRSRLQYNDFTDFLLGYELGYDICASMMYYKNQMYRRTATKEEDIQIRKDIETIVFNRLSEIRQAILRAD